jgi:hypothetical protein
MQSGGVVPQERDSTTGYGAGKPLACYGQDDLNIYGLGKGTRVPSLVNMRLLWDAATPLPSA